jgi:hypothetical protein
MGADDDMPSAAQVQAAESGRATHPQEPHSGGTAGRLNWLRAAVLGANDGIVSVAGIVIGVAGATTNRGPIFTAGLAGLVAGAVSMALGEYVSVSSQRDSERGHGLGAKTGSQNTAITVCNRTVLAVALTIAWLFCG